MGYRVRDINEIPSMVSSNSSLVIHNLQLTLNDLYLIRNPRYQNVVDSTHLQADRIQ